MTVHEPDLRPADVPPAASDPTEAGGILTIDLADSQDVVFNLSQFHHDSNLPDRTQILMDVNRHL